jgi:AmmeMemoRadiSam system protein B/AmmeMemoRadiSam system protein A
MNDHRRTRAGRSLQLRPVLLVSAAMVAAALGHWAGLAQGDQDVNIRQPCCAGSWYPGDAEVLTGQITDLLAQAGTPTVSEKPIAVVAPHAGYRYSAPVAATGYGCLRGHSYKRVIVLAFSHRNAGRYRGVEVPREHTAYRTPLGDVPIDREVCDQLLSAEPFISQPGVDQGEHSLELQLPFLQHILEDFTLVPLYLGRMDVTDYTKAAKAILQWLDGETLLVASTDFTHYGRQFGYTPFKDNVAGQIRELADHAAAPLLAGDFDGFVKHLDATRDTICGRGPVSLLLRILSMKGGAQGTRTGIDFSGRMMNDWSSSVTYQAIVYTPSRGTVESADQEKLLTLARQTATAYLNGRKIPEPDPATLTPKLRADGACFVTLQNNGRLRGCIGNMEADGPLYQSVIRNAVSACRDYRFVNDPVKAAELDEIDIEISYLTPMKPVADVDEIVVGRHGLLIASGAHRGVLLPQVAYERGWTRAEFLAQTCRKAGLAMDAWKQPEARIYSFTAEVFGEKKKH